jgi:hypothetical protein
MEKKGCEGGKEETTVSFSQPEHIVHKHTFFTKDISYASIIGGKPTYIPELVENYTYEVSSKCSQKNSPTKNSPTKNSPTKNSPTKNSPTKDSPRTDSEYEGWTTVERPVKPVKVSYYKKIAKN